MTISLIDTVQDALTSGGIVNGAASTLGIPPAAAAKGLSGAGSTMLAALANRATDPLALGEFFNLVQDPALAGPTLDDPSRLLSGATEGTRARELGHQLTTSLFGGRTDEFTAALAQHAAIDESAARSLIGMAAPLLLRAVGGLVRSGGLTVATLGQALRDDHSEIVNAVPPPLANLISRAQIYDTSRARPTGVPQPSVAEARRPAWWAIPLALLPLVLLGVWFLRERREPATTVTTPPVVTAPAQPPPSPTPIPTPDGIPEPELIAEAPEPRLKTEHVDEVNRELRYAEDGVEARLLGFLRDKGARTEDAEWFELDRLVFNPEASTLATASTEQLDNLAAILNAYPGVHIKVGGYTDNTGDPEANRELSQERADRVKAELVKRGIAADRVETEGYGEQYPVAPNATQEGRAKNRRVALRVVQAKT